jgi:sigma-B regulation protein RsbU (phosphoserine phosphatase)
MARLERIIERLELKEFQLRALLDVTKAINSNMKNADLLSIYERIVHKDLGITRLILFERADGWERLLAYGTDEREAGIDVEAALGQYKDIQVIAAENADSLGAFDVAVPVYHREKPLAFLLIGDIDEDEQRMSPTVKHLNFIQTLTNLIVVAMENKRLARKELQQELDRRELDLAAAMQSMLVPRDLPQDGPMAAAAWYQPHRQVGGDYYDLILLGQDRWLVCVADVSGKGMAAALLMSNFQAALHALGGAADMDLEQLVHRLNERVQRSARGERFITLFVGVIDLSTRRMRFVNAGHNPPLLHSTDGISSLMDGSIALGMMPSLPFLNIGETALPPGSTLLCYTDGLVEQEDMHGNDFGTQPLDRILSDLDHAAPSEINAAVIAAFGVHRGSTPYLDDIALLTCRFA